MRVDASLVARKESRISNGMIAYQFGPWIRPSESLRSMLIRYGSALVVVFVAIALRLWLDPVLERAGFALSLTGMLLAAWLGGLGPCLIGQTLILFAEALWFNPSHEVHSPGTLRGIVSLVAFYSVGGIVAVLSEAWQAARNRAVAEKHLAIAQREQLHATFACVGDGVLVTDANGRLTLMNPVAEAMTGWSLIESKGKPVRDVFAICDEQSRDSFENPVQRVLREGQVLQETMRLILTTRNDCRLPVSYSAAPIFDAHGKTTGVVEMKPRCETPTSARMSFWRRWLTSFATRWPQFAWVWNS
jgi:PAS domain S-box-containing protein